jgi:hypothetical protein
MALETIPKPLADEEVVVAKDNTSNKTESEEVLKH